MIALEFIPTPYDIQKIDHAEAVWEQHRTILGILAKQNYTIKTLHTGVRGNDCFYEVETEDLQALKIALEQQPLVSEVEIASITLKYVGKTFAQGLRVTVPFLYQIRQQ